MQLDIGRTKIGLPVVCVSAETGRRPVSGRTTDAIDHLRRAVGASEKFRTDARTDSDLDPIRDEPSFKALIGE